MKNKELYSDQELAEAFIFPIKLTAKQKKEAAEQLAAARKKTQESLSAEDKRGLLMLQLKFRLDDYLDSKVYDPEKSFGFFLKKYITILGVKRKAFAEAISVDETMLSQLINMHRTPPDYIFIRLELYSDGLFPAEYWFRLVEQQKAHRITSDTQWRLEERKFVHGQSIA